MGMGDGGGEIGVARAWAVWEGQRMKLALQCM